MDKSLQGRSDSECFEMFTEDPKNSSKIVVEGAHKFIANTIRNGGSDPTVQKLIKIFTAFSKTPIKNYVFTRMTKPILLELALCIVQDIALNGPKRAQSLTLELVNSKAGGKVVRVADPFEVPEGVLSKESIGKIDEAFFTISDGMGASPDVNFVSGQGHKAPYSPFGGDGSFIRPRGNVVRSLEAPLEVTSCSQFNLLADFKLYCNFAGCGL